MTRQKPDYSGYTGIISTNELQSIMTDVDTIFNAALISELMDIIDVDKAKTSHFRKDIVDITVKYKTMEAKEAPTSGASNMAIIDCLKLATELNEKLTKIDISAKAHIMSQLNDIPTEPFESDTIRKKYMANKEIIRDRQEAAMGYLEILLLALGNANDIKFPKKSGPAKGNIKHYIVCITKTVNSYASMPVKITITKDIEEKLNGNLYVFIDKVLSAVIGSNYTSQLSNGGIYKTAKKFIS